MWSRRLGDADVEAAYAAAATRSTRLAPVAALLVTADRDGALEPAARRLLATSDAALWGRLDWWLRRGDWTRQDAADRLDRAQEAADRLAAGTAGPLALAVAASHRSGYVREAAVRTLATLGGEVALPVLALRCADWVPQVRDAACAAVDARLATDPYVAVGLLPYALRVRQRDGERLVERLDAMLRTAPPEVRALALAAPDAPARRYAFDVALAAEMLDLPALVSAARRDHDVVVRARTGAAAVALAVRDGRLDAIRPLLRHGVSRVRVEALHAVVSAGDVEAAYAALADHNATVRAYARAAARRAGDDPAARYRALLRADPPPPNAVRGLGEAGGRDDVPALAALLGSPVDKVRAAAVWALRQRQAVTASLVAPLLADDSPTVVREAVDALRRFANGLDPRLLASLADPARPAHVRYGAFRLLRDRGPWQRLLADLVHYDDADPQLRWRARRDLDYWLTELAPRLYDRADAATAAAVAARLETLVGRADDLVRRVAFHCGIAVPDPYAPLRDL